MTDHLRFAPEVLKRLGEELNPNPEQGILELVRNAYDADAASCGVALTGVGQRGGKLTITDDGIGMTREQLTEGWLVLGSSSKTARARTAKFNRLQVGSKGLGRLAALRLGTRAVLKTRPEAEPGTEHVVTFDWQRFSTAGTVDEVPLQIETVETDARPGSTIEVVQLKRKFTKTEVTRIARALLLLASPFESKESFRPYLKAPEFKALEKLVHAGYWEHAAYDIKASFDSRGKVTAEMTDHERGGRVTTATHDQIRPKKGHPPYKAPAGTFELSVFRLSGDARTRGRTPGVSLTALREWLKVVGGVHLYHRGLRVYPYGDRGHDWIDMNLLRAASPEERPSTNNSIGRVTVLDEAARLEQKTDRTGFIESESFQDLRTLLQDVLNWAASSRLKERESRRRAEVVKSAGLLETAQVRMKEEIEAVPPKDRARLEKVDRQVRRATSQRVNTLNRELELYRSLATIGTTTAVMAHESFNPPNAIIRLVGSVRSRVRRLLGAEYSNVEEPVDAIEQNARRMAATVGLPRELLAQEKRTPGIYSLNEVAEGTLALLAPLIEEHKVEVETEFTDEDASYSGTIASMESVVANLVINAVSALNDTRGKRLIRVQTAVDGRKLLLDVADNGPGIRNIDLDEIWLPGRSTTNSGVGLGLTIVRDIVNDFRGTTGVEPKGELGGAQFVIQFPRAGG